MPTSADHESQIRSCLAYQVLRDSDPWIGSPSTTFLQAFLCGAQIRADFVQPTLPDWRVSGVLDDPVFYKQFLDATGHPTLSIKWATALELTHFSLADGFNTLKTAALAFHRAHGVLMAHLNNTNFIAEKTAEDVEQFWTAWSKRPMMYMGGICG